MQKIYTKTLPDGDAKTINLSKSFLLSEDNDSKIEYLLLLEELFKKEKPFKYLFKVSK